MKAGKKNVEKVDAVTATLSLGMRSSMLRIPSITNFHDEKKTRLTLESVMAVAQLGGQPNKFQLQNAWA